MNVPSVWSALGRRGELVHAIESAINHSGVNYDSDYYYYYCTQKSLPDTRKGTGFLSSQGPWSPSELYMDEWRHRSVFKSCSSCYLSVCSNTEDQKQSIHVHTATY